MSAATVVQVLQDLFLVLLHVLFYLWSLLPRSRGRSIVFDRFLCFFFCFFVSKITRKRLDRFAWNFQGRYGVTMGRPDYIFGQFRETARWRDAQHGVGVCCAFAPSLFFLLLHACDRHRVRAGGFDRFRQYLLQHDHSLGSLLFVRFVRQHH